MGNKPARTPFSRVFTIEDGAGPANSPTYQGQVRVTGTSVPFGDRTPVREPDPDRYGQFRTIDATRGEAGLATADLEARYSYTLSEFLRLGRKGCDLDIQVHFGQCQDPQDFNGGWDKILVLEHSSITQWGTNELGALEKGQDAIINESVPVNSLDFYEVVRIAFAELAQTELVQEVVALAICDSVSCGACGVPSNGCQAFFAITKSAGGSPGLPAEIVYSSDGGTTLGETNISTIGAAEDPDDATCVGIYLVVVSNDSGSLHYAPIADILTGTETWVEVTSGFVTPTGDPNAIFSLGTGRTWIVGDGGYIYHADDITDSVDVQSAGGATAQNLNDIHGFDEQNLLVVGASNAVVYTEDGGSTWVSVTGPAVGVDLNCCWMRTASEWFIGTNNGKLYYTRDKGVTWTERTFPGSGSASAITHEIVFATPTVGYMAHALTGPAGRILRTIDGGHSWYVLPEGASTIPTNDYVGVLAACSEDPNLILGGGLAGNGTDGFLVRGRGA